MFLLKNKSLVITIFAILLLFACSKDEPVEPLDPEPSEPSEPLSLEVNYTGYSAFNVKLNNLNPDLINQVYLTSFVDSAGNFLHSGSDKKLLHDNYPDPEILVSGLPLTTFETRYILEVVSLNGSVEVSKKNIEVKPIVARRLPDKDLFAIVHNVGDTYADYFAENTSTIPDYDPNNIGPTRFNVYLNDESLGTKSCAYFAGTFRRFPKLTGLIPGTNYTLKIEVKYENNPADIKYEPDLDLTTTKEMEFTTYKTPLISELDVTVENITSESFDLHWRTDLTDLYGCIPDTYSSSSFTLKINDEVHTSFNENENPIKITGLAPGSDYTSTLIYSYKRVWGGEGQKQANFTITTEN